VAFLFLLIVFQNNPPLIEMVSFRIVIHNHRIANFPIVIWISIMARSSCNPPPRVSFYGAWDFVACLLSIAERVPYRFYPYLGRHNEFSDGMAW
jgi:hypothetical protein